MKLATKLAAVVAGTAVMFGAAACGSSNTSGSSDASSSDVTLDWSFWSQGEEGNKTWKELAAQVTEKYPNIKVNLTTAPFADYFTKLQSQLAGGTAPCIVSMQSLRLPAFAKAMEPMEGPLAEAAGFKADEWSPGALKALQSSDKQYALPYGLSTMVMYYNKDAFKAAGVEEPKSGWTTDEFIAAGKKVSASMGKPAFGESFSDLHMYSQLLAFNGARPVSDDGALQLTDDKVTDAFGWYTGLATDEKISSVPASSSDVAWGEQQFVAGNTAMAVDGTWNIKSNVTDAAGFKVGVVALPQGANGAGTFSANSGFGISKTCKNKEAAAKAIGVLTDAASQAASAKAGNQPARLAATDAFIQGLKTDIDPTNPGYSDQVAAVVKASSEKAVPFISTGNWDKVTKLMGQQFQQAYTDKISPEEALKNVQESGAK
ncbi:sugar ABC transporter substrate-binding protein [Arthrobacter sp. NtRootA4]|uniref:ABC transporter substrate-binding protein n=1 Tax=Paenarthrobacter sp. TAF1 TaxID=3233067 RepID=UPI000D7CB299|nr:sugar ABC transporter substrate-binding protein [Arthrobacter sp. NtRootA2]BCW16968.1 sugar ABC transporter substrate-binding protein [Arthrobacter sp. NtRootA4]BCW21192.1 sugar ABC transporter substrate-binding protein [Arthrobacter sp. NtRootC7]BCW25459.1 sugar ABC transporter substrate-binding protein [Arthrobacter sp. NtRootC45]BCW29728.1 sugar ABC transporter substrate-binding protein [Arthrobacter sp. NtRootD5]